MFTKLWYNGTKKGGLNMKKIIYIGLLMLFLVSLSSCFDFQSDTDQAPSSTNNEGNQSTSLPTVSSPVHFQGIDEKTYKTNVHNIYGTPIKIFEKQRSEQYYLAFLGISGFMDVTYMNNSDKLFIARFTINSKDFDSSEAYDAAVNKTISHFESTLVHLQKNMTEENGKIEYQWHNVDAEYAYSIYYTQAVNEDENGNANWNDLSDATVFQFCRYSIIDTE